MKLLLAVLLSVWACAASAQDTDASGLPDWSGLAERAELVLREEATRGALEALRADLSATRDRLREAEGFEATRRETLRTQIAALGEPPAEGEEDPDVAARRAELRSEFERIAAPARRAEAERVEVEALIAEIDARVEAERRAALLLQEQSPVTPSLWLPAAGALGSWIAAKGDDLAAVATPEGYRRLAANATEVGILFFVAVLLLARSRDWLSRLQRRFSDAGASDPKARLIVAGAGLAQLVLPVLGLFAVTRLARLAGIEGPAISAILSALPWLGALVLGARWIGAQAFPPHAASHPLPDGARVEARLHATLLGLWLALHQFVLIGVEARPDIAATRSVPVFVLIFLAGLSLLRLGRLFGRATRSAAPADAEAPAADAEEGEMGLMRRALVLLGRAAMVVGVAGPVLAALGYVNAAGYVTWPAAITLGVVGLVVLLQSVIFDLWAVATGRSEPARDALIPTLIAFALILLALPVLALVWGVRVETLGEWWRAFLDGVPVGQTRISPAAFLTFAVVFVLGYLLTRAVQAGLRTSVLPKTKLDAGGTNAILSGTGYVGITLAALVAITSAGIDLSGLAIVAGALSVGVGFGLQTIVQNFVSGIILLIERPIKIGDWVAVGTTEGFVRAISVRSTRIETFDRQDVIVPNADLISQSVVNNTLGNNSGRVLIPVGVAYGNDTRRVQEIIQEVCMAHPMVVLNPPPLVTFEAFGASSLDFLARCVLRDVLWKPIVGSDIRHALAERLAEEGIEVPFPQQDVWLKNPEALRPPADTPKEAE